MVENYQKPILENKKIGIGIASAMKNVGLGSAMVDSAAVIAEFIDDHLLLKISSVDSGQGSDTVARQIGATEFGCNANDIELIANDTLLTLDSGVTTASRQTYVTGNAIIKAVSNLKNEIIARIKLLNNYNNSKEFVFKDNHLFIDNEQISYKLLFKLIGKVVAEGHYIAPKTVPLQEDTNNPNDLIDDYNLHFAYDFGTQAAVVAVDKITNEVEVLKVFAAHDVGKIINKLGIKGQIEGGIVMGLGYALSEEFIINEKGIITNSFKKIGVPLIKDAPEIKFQLIENSTKNGPYGAKGIGEITMVPTTPAIINAIYDATGIRITNLPAKSNKLKNKKLKESL